MAQSAGLHEPEHRLSPATIDRHRALVSLQEELEAVDWYHPPVNARADPSLAAILAHNREWEEEHACMVLEWLRRHDPALDRHLRTYLITSEPITEIEVEIETAIAASALPGEEGGPLGIGSLKSKVDGIAGTPKAYVEE
jgi:uncharacterized protein